MSSKTLLDTLKAVTGELGFSQPSVVVSSQVLTDIQLRYLALAAGEELLEEHDWQALLKKHTFVVDANTSLYALPSDFHRMVDNTMFIGEDTAEAQPTTLTWTRLNSGEVAFRLIGDQIEVFSPSTYGGRTLAFNYIGKNFVVDGGGGINKSDFSLDSDKTVYHPRLFTNLVKLKMLQTKNLDTRAAAADYNITLQSAISNDTPSRALDFGGEARLEQDWFE